MKTTRRVFLKSGGLALAGIGLSGALPGLLQSLALAAPPPGSAPVKPKVLVVLFQRGAVDGLNLLVPHAESAYYAARRGIAVPRPGQREGALDLDGRFGLHPALAPLLPLWKSQRMAAVHAAGSPDNTRSHFDAQDYMESGTPGNKSTRDGWLNRVLAASGEAASPFAAVAMTAQTPRTLTGRAPVIAMTSLERFAVQAGAYSAPIAGGFEQLWQQASAGELGAAGHETFEAVDFLRRSGAAGKRPEHGAAYPRGEYGDALKQLAQLIKADVGLRLGFAESGGWDTHTNQGGATGQLANRLREFGQGIAAFLTDLGPQRDEVLLVTMSEFGRTVRENGSRGTDHGHGNAMLLFGNGVNGGKVHGRWPGLAAAQLHEGRDLAVATDFRSVLGEIASRHLRVDPARVFPGFAPAPLGLLRAPAPARA